MAAYFIFTSVVIRAAILYNRMPLYGLMLALLAAYGALLVARSWRGASSPLIVAVQTASVTVLLLLPMHLDFFPLLFIPISLQAVEVFGRRAGFAWIGTCSLISVGVLVVAPLVFGDRGFMNGWQSSLPLTLLFGALNFFVGHIAHITGQARAARQENDRLYGELQSANRQLQEYAAQVEELSAAQERNRLARELHDSVTQTVFSMNLAVQAARMLWEQDRPRTVSQIERLQALARGALAEIQTLVAQLRPASAVEEGLAPALRRLLADRQARDGMQVTLDISGEANLPGAVTQSVYRIVQEALNNVAKHAGPCDVTVRLRLSPAPACVEIEDNGAGFSTAAAVEHRGHVGLLSMAERAREIGWRFSVDSSPGRGTRVRIEAQDGSDPRG